ncbi:hypothetical protein AOZ06_21435 [Kibdelosporangium phytohabitans]|uniref:Uncharacterized protein n=1 Tax=Kibdelosporangium phytohabitans TaxID=860235 RepID=A0A0N9IIR1_9PSEU|nr:hypothetical protein AOZ06_21435 [Kibdelosporangium phytohabitans]
MIKWAGWLITLFGSAHMVLTLTLLGAGRHAGAWFSGELWRADLVEMNPATSALWLSVDSFGVPLIVIGLIVLWLNRHGSTPPPFIAWVLGIWVAIDAVIMPLTPWPVLLLGAILLLVGIRRAGPSPV